jgi:hypothetical protein
MLLEGVRRPERSFDHIRQVCRAAAFGLMSCHLMCPACHLFKYTLVHMASFSTCLACSLMLLTLRDYETTDGTCERDYIHVVSQADTTTLSTLSVVQAV